MRRTKTSGSLHCSLRANVLFSALMLFSLISLATPSIAQDQPADIVDATLVVSIPAPPESALNVDCKDNPNDKGDAIVVNWELSSDDREGGTVEGYTVMRSTAPSGPYEIVGAATRGASEFIDGKAEEGVEYYYRVDAYLGYIDSDGLIAKSSNPSVPFGPIVATAQWFNTGRSVLFFVFIFVAGAVLYYISKAKSGTDLYVRKIAGIDAVQEAVGRATEMGKKIFFIPGIQDMNDVQTIAGMAILGRVAQVAAEYETWLEVPVCKSLVMVTARETMKESYSRIGRPDLFNEDQVHFVTEDQFGYAAALDGMFVREKPATIFYMGAFFAESLILAETGNEAGAIQIAGTAMPSQLPFFVAACDYTLIGEELFAASAYLSREPRQLGSLKGQDIGKALFLIAMIVGLLIIIIGQMTDLPAWMYLSQYFIVG